MAWAEGMMNVETSLLVDFGVSCVLVLLLVLLPGCGGAGRFLLAGRSSIGDGGLWVLACVRPIDL